MPQAAGPTPKSGPSPHPPAADPLIGRDGLVAAVVRLLRRGDTQLLILTGPGGSARPLAIQVAGRVAGDYQDGVVFTDLAPLRDPGLVLDGMARQLGVDDRDATPLTDRWQTALRERRMPAGAGTTSSTCWPPGTP